MMAVQSFNHWPQVADRLHKEIAQAVSDTAYDGQANVKAQIKANGQVRTGFMLDSVYAVTAERSNYNAAGGRPEDKDDYLLPEVAKPKDDMTAYFAVAASYAVFPNYGTSRQPARPFWEPGVEKTRQSFDARLAKIDGNLKGTIR